MAPNSDRTKSSRRSARAVWERSQGRVISQDARFSPNSRWIAYASNESGKFEVYIIPSDRTSGRWQISSGGGLQPVWRRDGKEIFYLALNNTLMSVPIAPNKEAVEVGAVRQLFRVPKLVGASGNFNVYDVAPDGQRLLVLGTPQSVGLSASHSAIIVLHFVLQIRGGAPHAWLGSHEYGFLRRYQHWGRGLASSRDPSVQSEVRDHPLDGIPCFGNFCASHSRFMHRRGMAKASF